MNLAIERKQIMELHTEYESMVKFHKFAIKNAETEEAKAKFQFQLGISETMTVVLSLLLAMCDRLDEEKKKSLVGRDELD